jgi:hypothetical protein
LRRLIGRQKRTTEPLESLATHTKTREGKWGQRGGGVVRQVILGAAEGKVFRMSSTFLAFTMNHNDQAGTLHDHDLKERLKEVGRQVARFAYLHTSEQALAFLRAWESAPVNPGGAKGEQLMPTT